MDIIDGKKKPTTAPPVATPSLHDDLDSASFFGAKPGSRNRSQKSMLRFVCPADRVPLLYSLITIVQPIVAESAHFF
jgi:hypothetical protein